MITVKKYGSNKEKKEVNEGTSPEMKELEFQRQAVEKAKAL